MDRIDPLEEQIEEKTNETSERSAQYSVKKNSENKDLFILKNPTEISQEKKKRY